MKGGENWIFGKQRQNKLHLFADGMSGRYLSAEELGGGAGRREF
jgi:hypothetical protein